MKPERFERYDKRTVGSGLFSRLYSEYISIASSSDTFPFPVLRNGLVPGEKKVKTEIKLPGMQGYLPAPETKRRIHHALHDRALPRSIRYGPKQVDVMVPAEVLGKKYELSEAIPMVQVVVLLQANPKIFVSEEQQTMTLDTAGEVLDTFNGLRDKLLLEGVGNVGLRMFAKIETVAGTFLEPLFPEDGALTELKTTTSEDVTSKKQMLPEVYKAVLARSLEFPSLSTKSEIHSIEEFRLPKASTIQQFIKNASILPADTISQADSAYFPPTIIVDVGSYVTEMAAMKGEKQHE